MARLQPVAVVQLGCTRLHRRAAQVVRLGPRQGRILDPAHLARGSALDGCRNRCVPSLRLCLALFLACAKRTHPLTLTLSISLPSGSGTRQAVQDGRHARLRRLDPKEGEGDRLRRLYSPEVVRRELQRPRAQRYVSP